VRRILVYLGGPDPGEYFHVASCGLARGQAEQTTRVLLCSPRFHCVRRASIVFAALPLCSPRFTHAARGETDHRTTLHEQRSVGFNKPVSPRPGWNAANANACQEMYDITVLRCFRRRGAETSRSLQPPTYTRLQTFAQCKASVPLQGNRLAIGQVFIVLEKLLSFARCCSVMLLRKKSLPPKF